MFAKQPGKRTTYQGHTFSPSFNRTSPAYNLHLKLTEKYLGREVRNEFSNVPFITFLTAALLSRLVHVSALSFPSAQGLQGVTNDLL